MSDHEQTSEGLTLFDAEIRKLFEHLAAPVFAFAPDGRLVFANNIFANLIGCSVSELDSCDLADKCSDDAGRAALAAYIQAAQAADMHAYPLTLRTKAGRNLLLSTNTQRIRRPDGSLEAVFVSAVETPRARPFEPFDISNIELDVLSPRPHHNVVWDWNLKTGVIQWDENMLRQFGYQPEEARTTLDWWRERVHPDDRQRISDSLDEFIRARQDIWQVYYRFRLADGSYAMVLDRGWLQMDADKNPMRMVGAIHDITNQMRADAALRESEERLRLAAQAVAGVLYDFNLDRSQFYQSAGLEQIVGYKPGQEPGGSTTWWPTNIHPDDQNRVMAALQAAFEGQRDSVAYEYRIRHRDGHWVYVWDQAYIVRDAAGRPVRLVGSATDITQRKQAESALRESEERYRLLANAMPQLVWTARADGSVDYYNSRAQEYEGFRQVENGDWVWAPALHPDDLEATAAAWSEAVRSGKMYQIEHRVLMRDGSLRWHLSRAVPARDASGQVVKWFGTATDIHESKLAETALRESEQRFRIALQAIPVVMITLDLNMRIIWGYNLTRLKPGDDIIALLRPLIPQDQLQRMLRLVHEVLETGQGQRIDVTLPSEGKWLDYDIIAEPLRDEKDEIIGLTIAAMDVSHVHRLEAEHQQYLMETEVQRQLAHQREMERLKIARDLHDGPVQDLLFANIALAEARQTDDPGLLNIKLGVVEEILRKEITDLREMCQDLRPPAVVSYGLERAISSHASKMAQRFPDLIFHLDLDRDGKDLSEDLRMAFYRIYQELMNNVQKHAGATEVWVRLGLDAEQVVLEVSDNGKGFDLPTNWLKHARKGHLGLIGLRERVDAIGGTLEIDTRSGEGVRVRVAAPRR